MHKVRGTMILLLLALAVLMGALQSQAETNTLVWHKSQEKVDADIRSWDLRQLLEHVAGATGWRVYLDPGAAHDVSVKFKGLRSGDALHEMLGNLNFAFVPETNGPARLYVFRNTRQQATRLISAPKKVAQPIPNELVVTLKPGSKTKIEDLARALGAKIIGRMDGQNAYLLQFPDDASTDFARQSLNNNPDVAGIGNNFPVEPPPALVAADANVPNLRLNPSTKNNGQLIIGLIDTASSVPANMSQIVMPEIHVAGDYSSTADQLTHGTAMLETIGQQLAATTGGNTSVRVLPVDVYGNSETTTTFDVANGIAQAINQGHANILNLSLGGTGDSPFLQNIINQALSQGILIYAAAGNDPVTTPTYPAAYPGVIAVTATDSSGQIASYANRGSFVQIAAPGDNVVSFDGQSYLVEGTSTSTAYVTGTAAGLADANHASANQAQSLLQQNAKRSAIVKE